MKKLFLIPNMVTAFGLACGLFVIFKVNMVEPGTGHFELVKMSALLLMVAAFADFIDGAIARVLKVESEFGINFDSMADAVSFGVAPSVLLLKSLSLQQGSWISFLGASGCMVYSLCGVLRLVRFNVAKIASKGNIIETTAQMKNFTGLPIPGAAAAAISANLLMFSPQFNTYIYLSEFVKAVILSLAMFLLGYLMMCRLKFPSFKALHFKVPSFGLVFATVAVSVFFLYGIFYHFSITLAVCAWGYILVALLIALIRKIAGKKSKTLEDFEPEDDNEN